MTGLADLLRAVAEGDPPALDAGVTVLAAPDGWSVGVLALSGAWVVSADVDIAWVRSWVGDDPHALLRPAFLTVLAAVTGRVAGAVDTVAVARGHGRPLGPELTEITASGHAWATAALSGRTEVRAWSCPGGVVVLGRGVAQRWEVTVAVDPNLRGFGLGRRLLAAALGLVAPGEPVWAQVAPGDAAGLRAVLAAGFRPVGAEVLLAPGRTADADPTGPARSAVRSFRWFTAPPAAPEPRSAGGAADP